MGQFFVADSSAWSMCFEQGMCSEQGCDDIGSFSNLVLLMAINKCGKNDDF